MLSATVLGGGGEYAPLCAHLSAIVTGSRGQGLSGFGHSVCAHEGRVF